MNTAEIIERKVQGDSSLQMRQLLAEGVGQARESSHCHPHTEILPFNIASRNVARVGIAALDSGYNLRDPWWVVPRIRSRAATQCLRHHLLGRRCRYRSRSAAPIIYPHGLRTITVPGPNVIALEVLTRQFNADGSPPQVRIGLRIVAQRIKMS